MHSSITELTGFSHLTDLPCWQLCHAGATVVVSNYGAHVLHYQAASQQPSDINNPPPALLQVDDVSALTQSPRLWLSPIAVWQQQQPIRGGVPICWPWFGKVDPNLLASLAPVTVAALKLPNHGLVRTRVWQMNDQRITADGVEIEFSIVVDDIPWTEQAVTLRYQVRLTHELSLTLMCDADISQQAALHSYFNVIDSRTSKVQPLPQHYYDKVSDSQQQSNDDTLVFCGEIDRVYKNTGPLLELNDGKNQTHLLQQGHDASVLWNPAAEKAATSADIPTKQWSQFVCVESARLTTRPAPLKLVQTIRPVIA
jgi:glucose-6-phosphate 1-epimerase